MRTPEQRFERKKTPEQRLKGRQPVHDAAKIRAKQESRAISIRTMILTESLVSGEAEQLLACRNEAAAGSDK